MYIHALKKLALLGAHRKPIELSSLEFASVIETSPQTAARKLKALEDKKYIMRRLLHNGQMVSISKIGLDMLQKEFYEYQEIFSRYTEKQFLSGTITSGLGEGQYYISLEGYRRQFREKLGFDPYPGTLNVRLDTVSAGVRKRIYGNIRISGFSDHNRTFGDGSCFHIRIKDIKGAVIIPERTHYPEDIIEIIAPVKLREYLNADDGSTVQVEVLR